MSNFTLDAKTFTGQGTLNGLSNWRETSGGVPTSFGILTFRLNEPNKSGSPYRLDWRLAVPVVAATDTACVCAGEVLRHEDVRITVEVPSNSTTAERTSIATMLQNLTANAATFQAALINLTQVT